MIIIDTLAAAKIQIIFQLSLFFSGKSAKAGKKRELIPKTTKLGQFRTPKFDYKCLILQPIFNCGQNIIKKRDEYGRGKKGDVQEGGE
jgi:hypothetical protein